MTITLEVPSTLEQRLASEAERRGLPVSDLVLTLIRRSLGGQEATVHAAVSLIESWIDESDGKEQKETARFLIRALDEDRSSLRRLFPPEQKWVSW